VCGREEKRWTLMEDEHGLPGSPQTWVEEKPEKQKAEGGELVRRMRMGCLAAHTQVKGIEEEAEEHGLPGCPQRSGRRVSTKKERDSDRKAEGRRWASEEEEVGLLGSPWTDAVHEGH